MRGSFVQAIRSCIIVGLLWTVSGASDKHLVRCRTPSPNWSDRSHSIGPDFFTRNGPA